MYQVLAFYKYVTIADAEAFCTRHLKYCKRLGIGGRILVSYEGLNGQLSGTTEQIKTYSEDLLLDPRFKNTDFKIDPADEPAFAKIHVRIKPEIVHSGFPDYINPEKETGKHLSGKDFIELKEKNKDLVIIDMRSNYEHQVGRFKDAITFDMDNFRELPDHLQEIEHLKDKTVVTYCTGGIKCEKASALLLKNGFKDVYQLDGGIIKYAKETGGKDFDGVCYVFDGRVTVPVNEVNPTIITHCVHCGIKSVRYINCANEVCNKQVIVCESCGWKHDGCCSDHACEEAVATKRTYDGTGYYGQLVEA